MVNERVYYSREAERRAQMERLTLAVFAVLVGLGVGTVIALIVAPQSGDKTRRQIGDQVGQAVAQGQELANQAAKDVRHGAEKLRGDVEERVKSIQN